jgi:hypothetical protein
VEIDWIELYPHRLHPLEIERLITTESTIQLRVRNHSAASITVGAMGVSVQSPGLSATMLSFNVQGDAMFKSFPLEVRSPNLPSLRLPVFVHRERASGDWVIRRGADVVLQAARDGSGARLIKRGEPVAIVAPLVHHEGVAPKMTLAEEGETLRYDGGGTTVRLQLRDGELAVRIQSPRVCEGPVLRIPGALEQGLFAGIEYLGKGERSSSKLDIETEEHLRFAPDPMKVTMPLMACRTQAGTAALTWTDMRLQPVFAAPNFLDGPEGHRMALRGERIEATIRLSDNGLEEAIVWAIRKQGLPPLPPAPRSVDEQWRLCLAAVHGPLQGENGWGHCAEPKWSRQPYADFASTIFRITGRAPDLPRLVPGGAHIRNDSVYFVTGRGDQWRQIWRSRAASLIREQQADGSFRYRGKYQRGHFEDTASGFCAQRAADLLEYARATGDPQALHAGLRALDYMSRFRTPRGAQTWELSLHTPDILAAAHLVRAYVRGYELTDKHQYLDRARSWALSGAPFVYFWTKRPIMAYATVPVYGATNWRAPNWIGTPVQWCGVVYAYAVNRLAPYDDSLDWRRLAQGILIAAEQMQYPDGALAGCLPDVFYLAAQQRAGPSINPCALVSLRLALAGGCDNLAVAYDGKHRVAAPFPVTIAKGAARVRAKAGMEYQLLVDGERIVDVRSQGLDVVPLN